MKQPTEPTSRLGFRGKKAKKTDLKLIAEKLLNAAQHNPALIKAAINVGQRVNGFKAQSKAKQQPKMTQEQIQEARQLLKQLEAQPKLQAPEQKPQAPAPKAQALPPQPKAPVKEQPTQSFKLPPPPNEYELRQMALKEQKAKLAASLKVVQYDKVFLKLKNVAG